MGRLGLGRVMEASTQAVVQQGANKWRRGHRNGFAEIYIAGHIFRILEPAELAIGQFKWQPLGQLCP